MAKSKNKERHQSDLNYFETAGSVSPKPGEANAMIDKSMEAIRENMVIENPTEKEHR